MDVLRENRGTLLAMLEAFLYDPLLHWTVSYSMYTSRPRAVCPPTLQLTEQSDNAPSTADKSQGVPNDQHQSVKIKPHPIGMATQSVAPVRSAKQGDSGVYNRIDNSLIDAPVEYTQDSWIAKVAGGAMTNAKALKVLATIEKKLAGMTNRRHANSDHAADEQDTRKGPISPSS